MGQLSDLGESSDWGELCDWGELSDRENCKTEIIIRLGRIV
jgi:hypothetical protein